MIRQLTASDLDALMDIWEPGIRNAFSGDELSKVYEANTYRQQFADYIADQGTNFKIWGYFDDKDLLGWVSILPCRPSPLLHDRYGEISLYLRPDQWNTGIANALVAYAMSYARDKTSLYYITAMIPEKNELITKLALSHGFNSIGKFPRSTRDQLIPDCLYWVCTL
jgi:L-amino acid N-acyltransferase YncA